MSYDCWNFVGNTNNQPRGYTPEGLLKVPWYLWVTDSVMNDDCWAGFEQAFFLQQSQTDLAEEVTEFAFC